MSININQTTISVIPPTVTSIVTQRILKCQVIPLHPTPRKHTKTMNSMQALQGSTTMLAYNQQTIIDNKSATAALLKLNGGSPTAMESLDEWQHIFGSSDSSESSRPSSDDDVGDDSDSDDESISQTDDEEETQVAKAMVKAVYQRMSQNDLDRIIDHTVMSLRKRQSSSCMVTETKKQRNDGHFNSYPRLESSLVPTRMLSMKTNDNHVTRTLTNSESLPAFKLAGLITPSLQNSSLRLSTTISTKPDDKLAMILLEASLPAPKLVPFSSIPNFFETMTADCVASYDNAIVEAMRSENVDKLRTMKESGKIMFCGNKFGETILHAAARRRSPRVVKFLLEECDFPPRVCCDSGRNPLHDAAWTAETNFDVVSLLLDKCPDLLYITDKRGFTPLQYIRKELWDDWCKYLVQRGADRLKTKLLA